jgi:hypothetical protein
MQLRRFAFGVAALVALLGMLYRQTRCAAVQHIRVCDQREAAPAEALLEWDFSPGQRPLSLIIDLESESGVAGSLTCDGDQTVAWLPLPAQFKGRYTLTTTATYRIYGFPKVITTYSDGEF